MTEPQPDSEPLLTAEELRDAARRVAMQTIYSLDTEGVEFEEALSDALGREAFYDLLQDYLKRVIGYAFEHREEIDETLSPLLAKGWDLQRIAKVDRAILRLAVAELEAMPEIAPKVTLNECVTLAETFGDKDSSRFVNGVFGKLLPLTSKANWDRIQERSLLRDLTPEEAPAEPAPASDATAASNWVIKSDA